jgi:serine/threonine protein kinase
MIDKEGNVRIMDFGIARSLEAKGITGAGVMIGTPEYMSPEQVEGKEVDQRSDLYSLGIILYEMVTGRVPFEGETPFTIGVKHKSETPENPKKLNTQISDDLDRLILRCLEKEKDKRYQSAGGVRSELTNIEKGIPTTERIVPERKPHTTRELTIQFSLKRLLFPVLVMVAVLIAGIAIWQLFLQKKAAPVEYDKPVIAVMYFENNTGDENLDQYRKAISSSLTTDLMQSQLINVVREDKLLGILKKLNIEETRSYSSEDLKKVAAEGGATHILRGNYTQAGENFRFNYTLHDVNTDEVIGSDRVSGVGIGSMFSMVDELTI